MYDRPVFIGQYRGKFGSFEKESGRVVQLVEHLRTFSGGCRFDPCHAHHFFGVA